MFKIPFTALEEGNISCESTNFDYASAKATIVNKFML